MRPVTFVCTFKDEDEESGIKMREIGLEGEKEEEGGEGGGSGKAGAPKLGRAGTTTHRVRRQEGGSILEGDCGLGWKHAGVGERDERRTAAQARCHVTPPRTARSSIDSDKTRPLECLLVVPCRRLDEAARLARRGDSYRAVHRTKRICGIEPSAEARYDLLRIIG